MSNLKYNEFEDWWLETEIVSTRSDRFYEEMNLHRDDPFSLHVIMLKWLKTAFDVARMDKEETEQRFRYSEKYDAYYDAEKNEWLESKCDDPNCDYCNERPDRPERPL